ncbi:MAG: hypothetical protein ACP6IQ_10905 [Candidatus Njordarchaeia archaeon]
MLPKVTFLLYWDYRKGPIVVGQYPADFNLDIDTIIEFFQAALQKARISHYEEVKISQGLALTYFTGEQTRMLFGVLLDEEENPDLLRGSLVRLVLKVIKSGQMPSSAEDWKFLWDTLIEYPKMEIEEKIGEIFSDKIARKIIRYLLEKGTEFSEDLIMGTVGTEEVNPSAIMDIGRTYIEILQALGILSVVWDKESLKERICLVRDVFFLRRRPERYEDLVEAIPGFKEEYESFVRDYIVNKKWQEDTEIIPKLFADPILYRTLKVLKEKGWISEDEATEQDLLDSLMKLVDYSVAKIHERDGERIFYIFSEPVIVLQLPRFTISKTVERLNNEEIDANTLIQYLETIKKTY